MPSTCWWTFLNNLKPLSWSLRVKDTDGLLPDYSENNDPDLLEIFTSVPSKPLKRHQSRQVVVFLPPSSAFHNVTVFNFLYLNVQLWIASWIHISEHSISSWWHDATNTHNKNTLQVLFWTDTSFSAWPISHSLAILSSLSYHCPTTS